MNNSFDEKKIEFNQVKINMEKIEFNTKINFLDENLVNLSIKNEKKVNKTFK